MKSDRDLLHLFDYVQIHVHVSEIACTCTCFHPLLLWILECGNIIFRTKDLKDELERALSEMQELKSARDRQATMVCEILKILISANLSKPLIFSI